jgi:hypothetical protein
MNIIDISSFVSPEQGAPPVEGFPQQSEHPAVEKKER